MKQLTCEMCGSTNLLKQEGVFVCQTCGTKYSVEEAKKMMIDGVVTVTGTVTVDNTDKIKNYLEMANSAYEAENKNEAETYCNRIIEIDPQNYEAWLIKGKAAGWQSTLARNRIDESIQCFSKAFDYAPDDNKEEMKSVVSEEISNLSLALINLSCSNYADLPIESNYNSVMQSTKDILNHTTNLLEKCGITPTPYMNKAAEMMSEAAKKAYNYIVSDSKIKVERYPSSYQYNEYNKVRLQCEVILKTAIGLAKDDFLMNSSRYIQLSTMTSEAGRYSGWDKKFSQNSHQEANLLRQNGFECRVEGNYVYTKICGESYDNLKKKSEEYRKMSDECRYKYKKQLENEIAEKKNKQIEKNKTYWLEHESEKQQLESERNSLQEQIKQLKAQLAPYDDEMAEWRKKRDADTPAQEEKKTVEKQISLLRNEQSSLGIFKGKDKKALQAQIDELSSRLPSINESIEAEAREQTKMCNGKIREIEQQAKPIKDKIAAAEKRINEIKAELTKDR